MPRRVTRRNLIAGISQVTSEENSRNSKRREKDGKTEEQEARRFTSRSDHVRRRLDFEQKDKTRRPREEARRRERDDTAKREDRNGGQGRKIRSDFSYKRREFSKRDWPIKERARRKDKHYEAEILERRPREEEKGKGEEKNKKRQEEHMENSDDLPPKKEDPGTFLFYCCIGNFLQCDALADLGSSANVLPLSMYKRGKLGELKPANTILRLAESTAKYPEGIVNNVKVKVGDMYFLVDFTVFDTTENVTLPMIFGRLFLATISAIINGAKGEMEISDGRMKKRVIYSAKIKHQTPTPPIPDYVLEYVRGKKREYEEELCKEEEEEAQWTKKKMEEDLGLPWRRGK